MPRAQAAAPPKRVVARAQRIQAGAIVVLLLGVLASLALNSIKEWPRSTRVSNPYAVADSALPAAVSVPAVVEPQAYKPLTAFDAIAENAQRPLDKRALEIAFPFLLPRGGDSEPAWERAVHCLALANYYEAASEGEAGMRAVSQVVLNRMRHPAFPHSVCETVFQGSQRSTGCQFTFTCDGSLARPPVPALFTRARLIAVEALGGRVEGSVGMATHYHANRVVPYWADKLDKLRTMGNHIFYVWRGSWGNRSAFRASYAGNNETLPVPYIGTAPVEALAGYDLQTPPLASGSGRINLAHVASGEKPSNRVILAADEPAGTLKIDEEGYAGTIRVQPALAHPFEKVLNDER